MGWPRTYQTLRWSHGSFISSLCHGVCWMHQRILWSSWTSIQSNTLLCQPVNAHFMIRQHCGPFCKSLQCKVKENKNITQDTLHRVLNYNFWTSSSLGDRSTAPSSPTLHCNFRGYIQNNANCRNPATAPTEFGTQINGFRSSTNTP